VTLSQIAGELDLEVLTPELSLEESPAIERGHASDLLSDVLANAPSGGILLTTQVHMNVLAVALHAAQAAVVFTSGMAPEPEVRARAVQEGLPLFSTGASTFDTAGRLYVLGLRGRGG
jgi:predicted transcriptional regulator